MSDVRRILVIAPHPDDESIGCGGTVSKCSQAGSSVQVVFLTSGENGGHGLSTAETLKRREREARKAASILGVEHCTFLRLPDGGLRASAFFVESLKTELISSEPELILAPYEFDMHADHRATVRALRRLQKEGFAIRAPVLMYEVWTPIQRIDHIEDISDQLTIKLRAIRAHRTQTAAVGFVEAFRGLARYRGEMHSWPGGPYAEVFEKLTF